MGKSATLDTQILALIFNGTPIPLLADNTATTPLTNLYVALHNADPGTAGNQTTNEISYTNYARVTVARTTGGWTVLSGSVSPVANIAFPLVGAGLTNGPATYWSVGSLTTGGAGEIFYSGPISPTISVTAGQVPTLLTSSTITES